MSIRTDHTAKMRVRKGDSVQVISGKDRGVTGKVISANPENQRVLVEGANRIKKHTRVAPTGRGAQQGGIITQEAAVHVSNVQVVCPSCGKPSRIGHRRSEPDAAGKTFSGPYGEVRKTQEGLVLSPASALVGTQLFGQKIPKFMVGRAGAGGGALHSGGRWAQVQVPDVTR